MKNVQLHPRHRLQDKARDMTPRIMFPLRPPQDARGNMILGPIQLQREYRVCIDRGSWPWLVLLLRDQASRGPPSFSCSASGASCSTHRTSSSRFHASRGCMFGSIIGHIPSLGTAPLLLATAPVLRCGPRAPARQGRYRSFRRETVPYMRGAKGFLHVRMRESSEKWGGVA